MKLKHVAGNIYYIKGRTTTFERGNETFLSSNSIFIDDTQKAIIDPGSNPDTLRAIGRENKIDYCFFSHSHIDHACYVSMFPDSKYLMHRDEHIFYLDKTITADSEDREITPDREFLEETGLNNFWPHERFTDGDTFQIGNTSLQVIHTPGHTRGHCSFYFPNEKVLFSADIDLSIFGPWYGQNDSNIDEMIESIKKIQELSAETWITGHFKGIVKSNRLEGKIKKYLEHIDERDRQILACLDSEKSLETIACLKLIHTLENIERNKWIDASERKMLLKHLKRMETRGKIRVDQMGKWSRVRPS